MAYGSGGHNRISDAEKKAKGTFRVDRTEEAYAEKAGAKVLAFPTLRQIPDPQLPLNEIGLAKYQELARLLFDAQKLTAITRDAAEAAAVQWQGMHKSLSEGKDIPAHRYLAFERAMKIINVANNAPQIGGVPQRSRFAQCGFAHRRPTSG